MPQEFDEARQSFLRTALEVAEAEGDSSSWVSLRRVVKNLGVDVSGEAGSILMNRYADMASYYQDLGDITDWRVLEEKFRLTAQGIEAAEGGR